MQEIYKKMRNKTQYQDLNRNHSGLQGKKPFKLVSVIPIPRVVHVYSCTLVPLLSPHPVIPSLVIVFSTPPATMASIKVLCTVILAAKCHPLKHSNLCRLLC